MDTLSSARWNILLVDDDEDDYILARSMLGKVPGSPFQVTWVDNYEQALKLLQQELYDAILVDYDLGARNGIELIREAIAAGCEAPFLLLTGRGNYEVDVEAMRAGAVEYLSKHEVNPRLLERTIRYAIDRMRAQAALRDANAELAKVNALLEDANSRLADANLQLAITNDELERRVQERTRELRESEQRLLNVVQSAPMIIWAMDRQGKITHLEGKGLQNLKLPTEPMVGKSVYELLGPYPQTLAHIRRALAGEQVVETFPTGDEIVEARYAPIYDSDGHISGVIGITIIVTDRVLAEQKLAYQAHLLNNVSDAVVATDAEFRMTAWNRAAERIYGWTVQDALGRNENEFLHTEVLNTSNEDALRQLWEKGEFQGEVAQTRKDGQRILLVVRASALYDLEGKVTGLVSIASDITQQRQAEEQRDRQAQQIEALAQLSQVLAEVETDYQQVVETVAQQVAHWVGDSCVVTLLSEDGNELHPVAFHHAEPWGQELLREVFTHPYPSLQGFAHKCIENNRPMHFPIVNTEQARAVVLPNYWHYLDEHPIRGIVLVPLRARGGAIGTITVTRDITDKRFTPQDIAFLQDLADRSALAIVNARLIQAVRTELSERQRAESALRESEARFRTIFSKSALGILLLDPQGCFLAVNPAFCEMIGYAEVDLLGDHIQDYSHPDHREAEQAQLRALLEQPAGQYRLEKQYLRRGGQPLWVRETLSMVCDSEDRPQFAIGIVENIHENKLMQAELAEAKRRLIEGVEAERLNLSQELHDGPIQQLYAIIYQANALRQEEGQNAIPPQVVQEIQGIQDQAQEIVHELRTICTQLRPPSLTPFGLEKALRSLGETFQQEHPEVQVRLDLDPDGQSLPEEVRVALFRICQHALVNIARHAEAGEIVLRLKLDEEQVQMEVQDDGLGFRVPERLILLSRAGHLGLVGASERADAIGGNLEVVSHPGQGTLIRVIIPRPVS